MKKLSIKQKITGLTILLVIVGFVLFVALSLRTIDSKVTTSMTNQFINENNQIADQAALILKNGGTTDDLQSFVEKKAEEDTYLAYVVVIDKNVTAVAHSDKEKIGKSYADDTAYTVPAAKDGEVMTSQFWADVQNAWTYDIMCPIYVDGELYGSMDVGIFNSEVDNVINSVGSIQIVIAVITTIVICLLIFLACATALKPFNTLVDNCDTMGTGDFSVTIPAKLLAKQDEVGKMAASLNRMKANLSKLISTTSDHASTILSISEKLDNSARDTKAKAQEISQKSDVAVEGSNTQTQLTSANAEMTEEISKGMEEIANNIQTVTGISNDTANKALEGAKNLDVVVNQMEIIEDNVSNTYEQIQELEKMSDNIQNVIQLIADISSQTNLLALNASIEAARAGEQGKGFAVVADEVGNLADQSKNAADDIGEIIKEIQSSIAQCVTLMSAGNESVKEGRTLTNETKSKFDEIIASINTVSDENVNA